MKTATLFNKEERRLAEAIGSLNYTNPFTPKRLEQERAILGAERQKQLCRLA